MSDTGYSAFSNTVAKTNEILEEIEAAYAWPASHRELSYHALRAVLHTLRDRLTVEEAADFSAQLPMLIRGLYYEGWKPSQVPVKMDSATFLMQVRKLFVFQLEDTPENLVVIVLVALSRHISSGELADVKSVLPEDIAALIPEGYQ